MTRAGLFDWAWRRTSGPERPVVLTGLAVRLFGLVLLAYGNALAWSRLPDPSLSLLLSLVLAGHAVGTAGWWLRRGRIGPAALAIDLPVGAIAIVASTLLGRYQAGWVGYVFPYTILISLVLGLAARTWWGTVLAGLVWPAAEMFSTALVTHRPLLDSASVIPSYLINPVVGWACAWLLRRGVADLAAAQALAVQRAAELSTEQERNRHAQALHDRVLQTLETLARGDALADPQWTERIATEALWLRRFVESGAADEGEDLASALTAAARVVERGGTTVALNDAALRTSEDPDLPGPAREALLAALHQILAAISGPDGHLVVRAAPERGGLLVTVLSTGPAPAVDPDEADAVRAILGRAGGDLRLEAVPYAELWVPGPVTGDASGAT